MPPRLRRLPGKNARRGPRYDTYTPLIASHERVLMDIWEHPALRWPSTWAPQPKKPMTYGNGKLCKFHNEYGHGTEECSHLRDEIERLVRENRLNKYVARQRRAEEERREDRREPIGDRRVEKGGTTASSSSSSPTQERTTARETDHSHD